ncbi:hypothetical protein [Endozoicomonas ascidiicola]|uniref:hypothetical protein n=1 Tax=Endozoicomonas ascidiicola TaxID=1698521 RepID=UPI000AF2F01A|nr:hypothetical protein [Endozoicomonas ascidiicola]
MIHPPIQAAQPAFSDSVSPLPENGNGRSWLGHGIAISKAFVGSMIPAEDPDFSINPHALRNLAQLGITVTLPASRILFMAIDVAKAYSGSPVPGPDVKTESPRASKATREEAEEKQPCRQNAHLQQPSTVHNQGSTAAKVFGVVVGVQFFSGARSEKTIEINDTQTLGKIGQDNDYPLDGHFQQTADINATEHHQPIGNNSHPFTGQYDGQCHTISGLSDCFVKKSAARQYP